MKVKTGKNKWVDINGRVIARIVYPYSPHPNSDKSELKMYVRSWKKNKFQITQ